VQSQANQNVDFSLVNAKLLDSVCQDFVNKNLLSGGVCIIAHEGKVIYNNAYGMQNLEENQLMQVNSLFRIASMTKPLTSVALLMLVAEGKIALKDRASQFIPRIGELKVGNNDEDLVSPHRQITIRDLLMHTSGTRSRGDQWFKEHGVDLASATSLQEYVDLLLSAPLVFHPGEGFNYAMNNDICARIIEIVSGQNFGQFLKERLLDPLEMNSTWFIVPEEEISRLSSIYDHVDGHLVLIEGKEPVQSSFPRGNGQLVSTAGDYMNFLQFVLDGGLFKGNRLLPEEVIGELYKDNLVSHIQLKVGSTVFPNTGFGLSVAISRGSSGPWKPMPVEFANLFQHLPAGSFLWPGITNTYFWVDPKHKISGVVLSQMVNPLKASNFQIFTQTFYQQFLNH
jgi:CubicO group peptidase (beta-lactamase class C family)